MSVLNLPFIFYLSRYSIFKDRIILIKPASYFLGLTSISSAIATYARTGLVGLFVWLMLLVKESRYKIRYFLVSIICLIVIFPFVPEDWLNRMETTTEASTEASALGRLVVWRWTIDYVNERPLMGGGFHSYLANEGRLDSYVKEDIDVSFERAKAFHSIYFEVLGELGYVGLFVYLWIIYLAYNMNRALDSLEDQFRELMFDMDEEDLVITARLTDTAIKDEKSAALKQNILTLRNRVNELGVAEPVIQQQGDSRIVVQLPGIQDTAGAKKILGATATLEFRLTEGTRTDWEEAERTGRIPLNALLYHERDGSPVLLKRDIIVTGDQIIDAASTIDQTKGVPAVNVRLDGKGAKKMGETTRENVKKPMAVVFIENKVESKQVGDEVVKKRTTVKEVINVSTIQEQFSARFQITGLESREARDLALLLRAGSLRAPVEIIEERTVGPSLGQDNIDQGFLSVLIGFALVLVFMAIYYKVFGLIANLALTANLVFIIAILSLLQATLTLPGIAGIVLTVGMAVDANVLIFERIREELRNGNTPQAAIHAGYEKAFSTITDANVTTLLAAIVLFSLGTGPVKGFAVTLSIGIITSMFTAIVGTRGVVNLIYGGSSVKQLPI